MNYFELAKSITRNYAKSLDLAQAVPNERWICRNCHHKGDLAANGNCARCGSMSVQPWAVIEGGQSAR